MLKKWIKRLVKPILQEVLQERADQVKAVTEALISGGTKDCPHNWGKWREVQRYTTTSPSTIVKDKATILDEKVSLERSCLTCNMIEGFVHVTDLSKPGKPQ